MVETCLIKMIKISELYRTPKRGGYKELKNYLLNK